MTMRELARLAGVSQATISLALRNHPRISAATKARVARLVTKHKYVVDGKVRELMRTIRSHAEGAPTACLGMITFYPEEHPWLNTGRHVHLARLHRSMVKRAAELGYRVEPFWVKNPAMKVSRLSGIIESRGIQGLLSLGAPELEEEIPVELRRFVIVTQGASIATKLHRIINHFVHNSTLLLTKLKERGYRRPGVVLQQYQDGRNAHIMAGMYLYFARYLFDQLEIPILYSGETVEPAEINQWYRTHRPDVVIYSDHKKHYQPIVSYFEKSRLVVPRDVGLAVIDAAVHPEGVSGVRTSFEQMGFSAVDMLVSRLQQGEAGLPRIAKVECVEGDWVEGVTLRAP